MRLDHFLHLEKQLSEKDETIEDLTRRVVSLDEKNVILSEKIEKMDGIIQIFKLLKCLNCSFTTNSKQG